MDRAARVGGDESDRIDLSGAQGIDLIGERDFAKVLALVDLAGDVQGKAQKLAGRIAGLADIHDPALKVRERDNAVIRPNQNRQRFRKQAQHGAQGLAQITIVKGRQPDHCLGDPIGSRDRKIHVAQRQADEVLRRAAGGQNIDVAIRRLGQNIGNREVNTGGRARCHDRRANGTGNLRDGFGATLLRVGHARKQGDG